MARIVDGDIGFGRLGMGLGRTAGRPGARSESGRLARLFDGSVPDLDQASNGWRQRREVSPVDASPGQAVGQGLRRASHSSALLGSVGIWTSTERTMGWAQPSAGEPTHAGIWPPTESVVPEQSISGPVGPPLSGDSATISSRGAILWSGGVRSPSALSAK